MSAGFVALDLEKATYPRSLVPRLQEMDYRVDVDSQKAHESPGFFLRDSDRTLQARISAYRYWAPDLVLLANEGFNLTAKVTAGQLWGKDVFTGKHSQNDAFLLVRDDSAPEIVPEAPCVSDVVGIMDKITRRNSQ